MKKLALALFVLSVACKNEAPAIPDPGVDSVEVYYRPMLQHKWDEVNIEFKEVHKDAMGGGIVCYPQPDGSCPDTMRSEKKAIEGGYWDFRSDGKIYKFTRYGNTDTGYYDTISYHLNKNSRGLYLILDNDYIVRPVSVLRNDNLVIEYSYTQRINYTDREYYQHTNFKK